MSPESPLEESTVKRIALAVLALAGVLAVADYAPAQVIRARNSNVIINGGGGFAPAPVAAATAGFGHRGGFAAGFGHHGHAPAVALVPAPAVAFGAGGYHAGCARFVALPSPSFAYAGGRSFAAAGYAAPPVAFAAPAGYCEPPPVALAAPPVAVPRTRRVTTIIED